MKEIFTTKADWLVRMSEVDEDHALMTIYPAHGLTTPMIEDAMKAQGIERAAFRIGNHGHKIWIQRLTDRQTKHMRKYFAQKAANASSTG